MKKIIYATIVVEHGNDEFSVKGSDSKIYKIENYPFSKLMRKLKVECLTFPIKIKKTSANSAIIIDKRYIDG
jgi:hypothetical protein